MRRRFQFCGILSVFLLPVLFSSAGPIIREGDGWRYYKGSSYPPNSGGFHWNHQSFNDSGWGPASASGFGYADNDDGNSVLSDMISTYASVFIRRNFFITDTSLVTHLTLAVDYDDGFVAYINGTEVARRNMPAGGITNTTLASSGREASRGGGDQDPQEKEFITISPSVLFNGSNVLAISGHNASLGSSDFSLIPELYTNVTLVRGPYIQMPSNTGLTVVWRTDASVNGVVDYGFDIGYGSGSVTAAGPERTHVLHLPVQDGTDYFYRVRSGGVTLYEGKFRTRRRADQPTMFAVYGDFGGGSTNNLMVAAEVNRLQPDFTMTVGDNIYQDGQPGAYDPYWFSPFSTSMAFGALFPGFGNHDDDNARDGSWFNAFFHLPMNGPTNDRERNFSFDYGPAHIAFLNSCRFDTNDTVSMNAIKSWLAADLAGTTQRWKFAVFHHPPYTSQGSHSGHIPMRDNVVPILEANGVDLVLQGHNHFYERLNPINGVYYNTTGGGGLSLHGLTFRQDYSAILVNDQYTFTRIDIEGDRLTLKGITQFGGEFDYLSLDKSHPFWMDGRIDDTSWQRAVNGLKLYAAIKGQFLYVATQDAGEGSDHFIYVATNLGSMVTANWGKTGTVMQWGAFLADEDDSAFNGWFNSTETFMSTDSVYRSVTSGLNNNTTNGNGVVEGTIHLAGHFGSFPSNLCLAAAPYETTNRGWMINTAQVPAGDGDAELEPHEFLCLSARAIALDLPVAIARSNQVVEAGVPFNLVGSASYSPSGQGLVYLWRQVSGPAVSVAATNSADTTGSSQVNPPATTSAVMELVVFDGRFESNALVTITISPLADGDSDGLSDTEELTGVDNVLTYGNPSGKITNPALFDTDEDGLGDGAEAVAGTDPNSSASRLFLDHQVMLNGGKRVVEWPSVSGRVYFLQRTTNALLPFSPWATNLPATYPMNVYTDDVPSAGNTFLRLGVELGP